MDKVSNEIRRRCRTMIYYYLGKLSTSIRLRRRGDDKAEMILSSVVIEERRFGKLVLSILVLQDIGNSTTFELYKNDYYWQE